LAKDLVQVFCKGEGTRFGGIWCEFYQRDSGECRLLKDFELQEIFEKGRCTPSEILQRALAKHLEKYRDRLDPAEHIESMAFEIAVRLSLKRLTQGYELYVLQGYINRTVYCSVIQMLRREDPLVKRQCGSCKHLSRSRPSICQRQTIPDSRHGKQPHPYYGTPRNLTDRACKEGFDTFETASIEASPEIHQPLIAAEPDMTGILLADMLALLSKRRANAEDSRAKKHYERQYLVFCQLLDLLKQGHSQKEAIGVIAVTLGVSVKTIQRELSAIKEFFTHEGVFS
jgi:hypothetical protein